MVFRKNRLKKKDDFKKIFKQGKGVAGDFILLKFLKNNLNFSRFGFVISSRVSKKAIVRNKIKRRLREIVRRRTILINKGFDVVLVAGSEIVTKSYIETKEEVDNIFQKAKLYK